MNAPKIELIPTVTGLEPDQYVEYFGVLPDGVEFVIFRPREDWDYSQFRCFFGGLEVAVKNVVRYRDGGTTEVTVGRPGFPDEERAFFFPTCFKPELKPTYCGAEIVVHERRN